MSTTVSKICATTATAGMPLLVVLDSIAKVLKSSPITCRARGPANNIALTVETSSMPNMPPTSAAPVGPKA